MAQRPSSSVHNVRPDFAELNDLATEKCGSEVLFATDDWFAVAENLLKAEEPVFKDGIFTPYGKWMDGWETRRKRISGHDWCVIRLGIPGVIRGFDFNTAFFTGNYTPKVSVQAACLNEDEVEFPERSVAMGTAASKEQIDAMAALKTEGKMNCTLDWEELLPMVALKPGYQDTCHNYFACSSSRRWTHIRVNMYPDGGIARLHVFGQAVPDWSKMPQGKIIDLVAMENGGICIGYSDVHFGHARNLISSGRSASMADGWETARRLDRPEILRTDDKGHLIFSGKEWCVFRLGSPGSIKQIEIDTNHFKGNFPDSCVIEGCIATDLEEKAAQSVTEGKTVGNFEGWTWKTILPPYKLSAHKRHKVRESEVCSVGDITHVRLTIRPDGGISRLRLFGIPVNAGIH